MKKDDSCYYFYVCPSCGKTRKLLKTTLQIKPEYLQKCVICCNEEKKKETLKNCNWKERYKKAQKTFLEKYGVDNPNKLDSIKNKKKQTFKKHFGDGKCIREKQSQTMKKLFKEKKEEILEKRKLTNREKYQEDSYTQTLKYKEKNREVWKNKSEEELKNINEKRKHTKLEKYGDENYYNFEKAKRTNLEKYGVENAFLISFVKQNRRSRYFYDNQSFDSKPELCFYLYCKDQGLNIKRETKRFNYTFEGKEYYYFPDFEIDGKYYEIKGNQFLTENGKWQNPFDHNLDEKYEAKHQFLIKNNVTILYEKDYQKYIDYIKEKYGRNYLNQFCRKNN